MQRLERERELTQRLEALGRLAGGVAHDLNNLLTPVMGHTELIRLEPELSPTVRESSEQIAAAAQRAADLVQQLLTFARRDTDKPTELDLDSVVRDFAPLLQKLLPGNIGIKLQLHCGDRKMRGYRLHIEQILMNLVVNARDAMPDGGTIRIETKAVELDAAQCSEHAGLTPGRYLRLAVADEGVGMTPEVQARLFEPFFTTKAVGRGTGLGLATIHGIVQRAGGHVLVQSEPGRGSTFEALLPV
ncbi:MAG: hypothetical protein HY898_09445 [Deltaproteobacteria bacterium]|nr:hypothetical protein [Deltaproteobacteria bacterium]